MSILPAHTRLVVRRADETGSLLDLLGSDAPPAVYAPAQGTTLTLRVDDVNRGKQVFEQLMQDGTVVMPFDKTFWSPGYGMGIDRFGKPWMVNTEPA